MKFEMRGKPSFTPFSNPFPDPSNTVSMKMPQNTPNAVSAVRNLCWLSVLKISRHFSTSMNMAAPLFRAHRFDGRDLRGAKRRHETRQHSDADQERDRSHRHLEVHFRIHEIRHLRAGLAQHERDQLEQ